MDVLAEQLEVITGTWREGPFSFHGEHYELQELDAQPKPIQHPHPPLIIGGDAGPQARPWQLASPTSTTPRSRLSTMSAAVRPRVDRACEQAGGDPVEFSIMTAVVLGTDAHDLHVRLDRLAEKMGSAPGWLSAEDPPAGWIVATVDRARDLLGELERAGVSRVMCQHLVHEDLEAVALIGSIWPGR